MTKFSDLNLDPKVLKAVADSGYETPTPIQAGAIPPALEGRDVLGIAQTGTGKTASFTLPMISMLARGRARARMPRSLVLCPTRELAAQVAENFDAYAKYVKLNKALLIGGVSFKEQEAVINRGADVLIATPGRLLDHFERGKLLLTGVQIMVVDEADRMLDMGFIPDIERIFSLTPFTRQTLFFSATMAPEIERITNTFLSNPERVEMARQATTSENITQSVVIFQASRKDREGTEKRKLLRDLIAAEGDACKNAIIFCNRKMDVDTVMKSMKKYGLDAAAIHGDLEQSQRMKTLAGFRDGSLRFLVASDVAARGLDIPDVSHVFNYDVPSHAEDYVHRIGRTGRAGKKGTAIMICSPRDARNLDDIEALVKTQIPRIGETAAEAVVEAKAEAPAEDAPKAEKPKRTRTRKPRGEKAAQDSKPKADASKEAEVVAETAPEAPKAEVEVEVKAEPTRAKDAREDKAEKPARTRESGRGGRGSDNGKPVGLGEDMPTFIAKSFEERMDS